MRLLFALVTACALLIGGACALSSAQEDEKDESKQVKKAYELRELNDWVNQTEIVVKESAPPQFDLKLTVTMPTPGFELKVDEVSEPKDGRIQIKVTSTPPKGMVAQVLTDEEIQAGLGTVSEGRYSVEIWYRTKGEENYEIRDTVLLEAN